MELVACMIPINCTCRSDEDIIFIEGGSMFDRVDHFLLSVIVA